MPYIAAYLWFSHTRLKQICFFVLSALCEKLHRYTAFQHDTAHVVLRRCLNSFKSKVGSSDRRARAEVSCHWAGSVSVALRKMAPKPRALHCYSATGCSSLSVLVRRCCVNATSGRAVASSPSLIPWRSAMSMKLILRCETRQSLRAEKLLRAWG